MKNIGIDATMLTPTSGGILVYIQALVDNILESESNFDYKIFFSSRFLEQYKKYKKHSSVISLKLSGESRIKRIFLSPFVWPKIIRDNQVNLFHSPISYIPFGLKVPSIVTIHDLRSLHFPEYYSLVRGQFLKKRISDSARKASKIIAISDYTRNDIIKNLNVPPEKVTRIYQGFDATDFQREYAPYEIRQIKEKYHLPEKFILSVGHLEPRKNFIRLLRAFALLKNIEKVPHKLVIVGKESWRAQLLYDETRNLKIEDAVIFVGFVSFGELPAFYQLADLFVLPSLFEGFGFPPLESMAAGTPVVCSNSTSLPEVCGDAAVYFDPEEEEDIIEKMKVVLHNSELKQKMIENGFENIGRFNWSETARQTLQAYRELLN